MSSFERTATGRHPDNAGILDLVAELLKKPNPMNEVANKAPHALGLAEDQDTQLILDPGMLRRWMGEGQPTLDEAREALRAEGMRPDSITATALATAKEVAEVEARIRDLREGAGANVRTLMYQDPNAETGSQFSAKIWVNA